MATNLQSVVINKDRTSYTFIEDISHTTITKANLPDVLLSLEAKDIVSSLLFKIFGSYDGQALCHPYDLFIVPPGYIGPLVEESKNGSITRKHTPTNSNTFTTTVGIYVWNKWFIQAKPDLFALFGYVNTPINSKTFDHLNDELGYALLEDKISMESYKYFLECTQKAMPLESVLSPNYGEELFLINKQIDKKKDELFTKYDKELNEGNVAVAEKIDKELVAYARDLLKDSDCLDLFDSGGGGNFNNNFRTMFISKGYVFNPITGKYTYVKSNYADGISKEDYTTMATAMVEGPYHRAKKTADGGYSENLVTMACQYIQIGPKGSDCGTNRTVTVTLTPKNVKSWMYSYMKEGSKLVELNMDNMNKYIGKTVHFRYSSLCESKDYICEKCAGTLFRRLGMTNIGLALRQIPAKIKLKNMKAFHDASINASTMDLDKIFGE